MPFLWHRDAPELDAAIAADNGPAAVRAAAAHGGVARADDHGNTPLHAAAVKGARAAVAALVDAGARPRAAGIGGRTPAHLAAGNGHADTVRMLVDAGASPGAADSNGRTPAHHAAECGYADTLTVLLKAGAAVDPVTVERSGGETPLHRAAQSAHVGAAACLLACGADRGARNHFGQTPADAWRSPAPWEDAVALWEDAVALSRRVKLLTFGALDLYDPHQTLEDVGVPQGAQVELGGEPVWGYPPAAATGPHQLHVQSPAGESVCVEVARDATVGGVAALAARYLSGARAAAAAAVVARRLL